MAPICANKSDRKSYMTEIDGFSVLLTFPKPKANRSRKRRQFHDFFTFAGGCLIKTDPFLQDCLQHFYQLVGPKTCIPDDKPDLRNHLRATVQKPPDLLRSAALKRVKAFLSESALL